MIVNYDKTIITLLVTEHIKHNCFLCFLTVFLLKKRREMNRDFTSSVNNYC